MTIQIDQLALGALQTNCYIVGDTDTNEAIIIDPSAEAEVILEKVKERGYTVREILATHTHFDHVLASQPIKAATGAPFRLHQDGLEQLQAMQQRANFWNIPAPHPAAEPDSFLNAGDVIEVSGIRLETRFTPGHSPGHVTFVMHAQKIAFVGDCVFKNGVGRTDFPNASTAQLKHSVLEQILTLPDDYILCTGHGPITTIEHEKQHSDALAYLLEYEE